jgi:hypothetical protein
MSWQAIAWAQRKGKDYELDPTSRYVLMTLASFERQEGHIYPSLSTMELETGLTERTIRRCIKKLIAVGLIEYGDQAIVAENPRFRRDKLPKVYRRVMDTIAKVVDTGSVGRMPQAKKRPWSRKPKAVDNPPPRPSRPDTVSLATGHSGGNNVHQTNKPLKANPSAHAGPPPAGPVDYGAVRALREASRARLAARGILITEPLFALP